MLGRVECLPGRTIGILPFRIRHLGMMCHAVVEVVLVHIGVHPDVLFPESLVVFRARQRREEEQFEDVERQLAFDDFDVAQDRCLAVAREADDVTGAGDCAVIAPFLQHLPVVGDLVLPLFGGDKIVRIDVLKSDEHATDARLRGLFNEIRNLVTQRVDLNGESYVRAIAGAQLDQSRTAAPNRGYGRNCRR